MNKTEDDSLIDLKTLAWRLQGLGHFLKHTEPDACASRHAFYGIGDLIEECGLSLEAFADAREE